MSSSSSASASSSSSSSKSAKMLIKFESKSNRVKGLAFHPRRPWILASLHNGVIQLWDYRMEVLIDRYEEHDGPVRGIHFHSTQPIFVSGGDDYKIKVWNYQLKRCLFNLLGHLDYIRTVQFHHEYPWILSASDDQTIRIWNWQSRQCLSVLTGHNHYVMCAQFHPKEDLVLSASLDQTVRVWDVSGLRKKTVSIAADFLPQPTSSSPSGGSAQNNDIFGTSDVIVKHTLEGHTRGVNWAAFHRSLSLIVSGADDREVKLWRMNDSKAWEVDTMRGHINNVSCVLFHPKKELIVSNSEDKTIRVWDISKQNNTITFRRDTDRYWILDAHPNLNLLAAGHDSGLVVFKLNRERPPYDSSDSRHCYYYKDCYVYEMAWKTGKERPILSTRRRGSNGNGVNYRSMYYNSYNRTQHCIVLTSDADGSYELYVLPKAKENDRQAVVTDDMAQAQRGAAKCAVFVSRNRLAVLDKQRQLFLKTLKNETKRKISVPNVSISFIFPGGIGRLLLRTAECMMLYDIQSLKVLAELQTQSRHPIKYVCWSGDGKYAAMYSKANIYLTDGKLGELASINENSRIKSGSWDAVGAFVYTTSTHLKYLLPNGESGIIRTLDFPIYVTSVTTGAASTAQPSASTPPTTAAASAAPASVQSIVTYVDREGKTGRLQVEATEYMFKLALMRRRNRDVLRIMQSKKLVGESIIAYLHKKGYPEVALHFVEDLHIKFSLALECGNIGVALDCCQRLDNDTYWHKLGVEALRQGNHQVVEAAYQKTKNFERLSFLYLITGNTDKLAKMLNIAALRQDVMGRFHNALYLGNVQERVQVLRECGQLQLAYLTAMAHGMEDVALALQEELGEKVPELPDLSNAKLLIPPTPILRESNWPLLEVKKGFFERLDEEPLEEKAAESETERQYVDSGDEGDEEEEKDVLGWGDKDKEDVLDIDGGARKKKGAAPKAEEEEVGAGWGDDLDLELPEGAEPVAEEKESASSSASATSGSYFVMPMPGKSSLTRWATNSSLAADLIAAGSFDLAMHMLNKQLGIVNFAPLKEQFLTLANATVAYLPSLPGASPITVPLSRTYTTDRDGKETDGPALAFQFNQLTELLKAGNKSVTLGKFQQALKEFSTVLHTIPFVVVDKRGQVGELLELVNVCREYVLAMKIELKRKEVKDDPVRQAALASYLTATNIRPLHLVQGLRSAIKLTSGVKAYSFCAVLCRRLLELCVTNNDPTMERVAEPAKIRSFLAMCERQAKDEVTIDWPADGQFSVCGYSFEPVERGKGVKSPYSGQVYKQEYAGHVCNIDGVAKIGADATGLKCYPE